MRRIQPGLLRKLWRLNAPEWAELFWAQVALIHAQLLVWTRPRGQLLAASEPGGEPAGETRAVTPEMQGLAQAVERVAENGLYQPSCLVRSLALQGMLASRGIRGSTVRVGVRLQGGHFIAHAWVEYDGQVLGDRDWRVRKFAELAQVEEHQPS